MVVLYNRHGESFHFSSVGWRSILNTAMTYGWKPAGTAAPPVPLDPDCPLGEKNAWDGNYYRPQGQTALPKDAEELAAALERAAASGVGLKSVWRQFPAFCRNRGFVIEAPPASQALTGRISLRDEIESHRYQRAS